MENETYFEIRDQVGDLRTEIQNRLHALREEHLSLERGLREDLYEIRIRLQRIENQLGIEPDGDD